MALLNSFTSGVSAVKTFGKSLEVIGDNIANVNTTGFKGSRTTNKDNFSDTFRAASVGGSNSMQVGSGTSVASISQKFTQGVLSTTGGPADLGIAGPGFFKVTTTATPPVIFYTRAGDFRLDKEGTLLTNDGLKVDGATTLLNVDSYQIAKDGTITTFKAGVKGTAGKINLFTFANPNALKREAGNLFSNFGDAAGTDTSGPTKGDIIQGTLELSNVDLTQEFSDLILAQRAFQAGSRIITVSDSVMEEIVNLKR